MKYKLMHKDDTCGILSLAGQAGDYESLKTINPELMPYLGHADDAKMRTWWKTRAVPSSRKAMMEVIRRAGCVTSEEYLAKNLALSMTDCYWICPVELELSWNDVCLWNTGKTDSQEIPYHNVSSFDPNASLGGQMDKYWDVSGETPMLVKRCDAQYGQQAVNEVFASLVHKKQDTDVPFVPYRAARDADGMLVTCPAFTTESTELIPAYEVLNSKKRKNDQSDYEAYIEFCAGFGIPEEEIRKVMDYQTLSDFVISNTDRHLMNFGILRDADTLEILGPAPIFDHGNSMFFRDCRPYTRASILEREITAFYRKEEGMLKCVSDRARSAI